MQIYYSFGWSPRPKIHFAIAIFMFVSTAIVAFVLYLQTTNDLSASRTFDGVVVDSRPGSNGMHTPVIEFKDNHGKIIRFRSKYSSSPQKYFRGDSVKILVNNETGNPKLMNFFTIYGLTFFATIFSLICLIGAIGIYFIRVRNET